MGTRLIKGTECRGGVHNLKPNKDRLEVTEDVGAPARKKDALNNIVSPTKGFFGDGESRGDLALLLLQKLAVSIPDTDLIPTTWKTVNGVQSGLTYGDIKLALFESLTEKGAIVGAT